MLNVYINLFLEYLFLLNHRLQLRLYGKLCAGSKATSPCLLHYQQIMYIFLSAFYIIVKQSSDILHFIRDICRTNIVYISYKSAHSLLCIFLKINDLVDELNEF